MRRASGRLAPQVRLLSIAVEAVAEAEIAVVVAATAAMAEAAARAGKALADFKVYSLRHARRASISAGRFFSGVRLVRAMI